MLRAGADGGAERIMLRANTPIATATERDP